MARFTPPIPLVADEEMLAQWFHQEIGGGHCTHTDELKPCETWARKMFESGFVKQGSEWLRTLSDNEAVKSVLKGHLADAWRQGWRSGADDQKKWNSDLPTFVATECPYEDAEAS